MTPASLTHSRSVLAITPKPYPSQARSMAPTGLTRSETREQGHCKLMGRDSPAPAMAPQQTAAAAQRPCRRRTPQALQVQQKDQTVHAPRGG